MDIDFDRVRAERIPGTEQLVLHHPARDEMLLSTEQDLEQFGFTQRSLDHRTANGQFAGGRIEADVTELEVASVLARASAEDCLEAGMELVEQEGLSDVIV